MDDPAIPIKRRPKHKERGNDIKILARVDKQLFDAVKRPNCSISYTINRALRICMEKEHPNDLKSLAVQLRGLKIEAARINKDISEVRARVKSLGIKDLHEWEDSLESWED
jgi:hypothetical protein